MIVWSNVLVGIALFLLVYCFVMQVKHELLKPLLIFGTSCQKKYQKQKIIIGIK